MKLDSIQVSHVVEAAKYLDHNGIPPNYLFNNYWVVVDGSEYPFKHLCRTAYRLANSEELVDFATGDSYLKHIRTLGFEIKYHHEGLSPISENELDFFHSVAGTRYSGNNSEHIRKGEVLKTLVRKLNFMAEKSAIEGFEHTAANSWKWIKVFKSYLWIKIKRPSSSGKVFFLVGCDDDANLFIKIDCLRREDKKNKLEPLSEEQQAFFDSYVESSNCNEVLILRTNIHKYDWTRLLDKARTFMTDFSNLYDELEEWVNAPDLGLVPVPIGLTLGEIPSETKTYAKNKKLFKGVRIDWNKKNSSSKALGDAGEALVKDYEFNKLTKIGKLVLAEKVHKKLDGEGYDILSYNEKEKEMHIEVKTTKRGVDEPFYMSLTEYSYLEENPENYFLYRLYDFNFKTQSSKFYILSGKELLKVRFTATNFEVSI